MPYQCFIDYSCGCRGSSIPDVMKLGGIKSFFTLDIGANGSVSNTGYPVKKKGKFIHRENTPVLIGPS